MVSVDIKYHVYLLKLRSSENYLPYSRKVTVAIFLGSAMLKLAKLLTYFHYPVNHDMGKEFLIQVLCSVQLL